MDFIKAQPPRPPRSSSQSISSSSSPIGDDGETESNRINDSFGLVSSTFKELYDYIALEGSNPNIFLGSDASFFALANETFLEINANLGSGGIAAANSTALSLLQNNVTGGVIGIAAATIVTGNVTGLDGTRGDVNAKGLQNTGGGDVLEDDFSDVIITAVTSIILGLMILITVIGELNITPTDSFYTRCLDQYFLGNVFVIAAIILERNLQNVANYLVASLAVADLLVACLVMPLGAVYEVCAVLVPNRTYI